MIRMMIPLAVRQKDRLAGVDIPPDFTNAYYPLGRSLGQKVQYPGLEAQGNSATLAPLECGTGGLTIRLVSGHHIHATCVSSTLNEWHDGNNQQKNLCCVIVRAL